MFNRVFQKIGKVAFSTSQQHTIKKNLIKTSFNSVSSSSMTSKFAFSFSSQSLLCQQMQSLSLQSRTTPLANGVALTIQNLREMLQKCKNETELESSSSTMGQYLVAVGIIDSNVLCSVDSCKTLITAGKTKTIKNERM